MRRDGKLVGEELYSPEHADMMPYLDNSLRAYVAYERDKEYVVMDGEIIIVDEFTGRLMHGRRFSEGLHQAIEAKEGVTVRRENVTMATITFQNYFRMYDKLAGMTGTAKTEEPEFQKIYNLDVVVIPTHQPIRRNDYEDLIFMSEKGKFKAVVEDIKERHRRGQPVLVGTVAIETSERLSKELTKAGVPHEVLNAKQHFREANIIAQAGRSGAVTIATNMAGRGVDILLGGNPEGLARDILRRRGVEDYTPNSPEWQSALEEAKRLCAADRQKVLELGGLYVLGTERHEARRIDNQLRGRAGRQGDPGESRFYLSLEDDLIRRFGGERVKKFMAFAGMTDDEPIENSMISSSIKQAQVRVEAHNFDIRKRVLEYDDVVNKQREDIYKRRRVILTMSPADLRNALQTMVAEEIDLLCQEYLQGPPDEWQVEELYRQALVFRLPSTITPSTLQGLSAEAIKHELLKGAIHAYDQQMAALNKSGGGEEVATQVEREIYLRAIDELWVRHLTDLSVLREGIGLEGLRGRNPLTEYQIQGFQMYRDLQDEVRHRVTRQLYHVELAQQQAQRVQNIQAVHPTVSQAVATGASGGASAPEPVRASARDQIGRNDPCWCGSGKKYKYCHYRADQEARQTVSPDAVKRSVKKRR
jgi:preprotein translocase subunit SecA